MMNPDDKYIEMDERIDSFMKGTMSKEEEESFKQEIANNEELRQRTKERLLLLKGIKDYGQQQDQKVIDSTKETRNQSSRFTLRKVITGISIAACIVVAVIFSQRYFNSVNGAMAENEAMNYAMSQSTSFINGMSTMNLRGGSSDESKDKLLKIFDDVMKNKDIKANISTLESLYATTTNDAVDEEDDFEMQISWFLAVAYLKDNNSTKAAETLRKLLKDYPDCKEAKVLLKKLE